MDIKKITIKEAFTKFDLSENTIDFLGHAVALYDNDDYFDKPAIETLRKIKLYCDSIGKYGDS
jgi:Rab GDP dissociation inhibitor